MENIENISFTHIDVISGERLKLLTKLRISKNSFWIQSMLVMYK